MGQLVFSSDVSRLYGGAASTDASIPLTSANGQKSTTSNTSTAEGNVSDSGGDAYVMGGSSLTDDMESVTYTSKVERLSLAITLQQLRAKIADTADLADSSDDAQTDSVESDQLSFSFFSETRSEELALFNSKTSAVADAATSETRESYIQVSKKIAFSFQMSMNISGEALSGFSSASEGLQNDSSGGLSSLIDLANDMLSRAEDAMNQVFSLLGGYMSGAKDSGEAFKKFISALFGSDLLSSSSNSQSDSSSNSSSSSSSSSTQLNVQMEFSFQFTGSIQMASGQVQQSDPITFDLDGDGFELTSYLDGAQFDITGSGKASSTAFIKGGDAFLAIDNNGNGVIDSGKELFGDQNGAANGYEELSKLDSNKDGVINKNDKDFDKLLLFKDNGNGKTENGELLSLADGGIEELNLKYQNVSKSTSGGNKIGQIASYKRTDGSTGRSADTILYYTA
jgi:hypothetical protein